VKVLEATVNRNPDYAPAWALLGYAECFLGYAPIASAIAERNPPPLTESAVLALLARVSASRLAALSTGEKAARRAIALDPNIGAGYFALAYIQLWRDEWIESEELFRKTLSLDPEQPDALLEHMVLLMRTGRLKDAMATGRTLVDLEPFVPIYRYWTALAMLAAGNGRDAVPILQGIPEQTQGLGELPVGAMLAVAYAEDGQYAQSAEQLRRTAPAPPWVSKDALEAAAQRISRAPSKGVTGEELPLPLTFVFAFTDEPDRVPKPAPDETGRFFGDGAPPSVWSPMMTQFRKSDAFRSAVQRAELVPYWQRFGWADLCRPVGERDFTCD
jgi:tetratricopeptide (TPR) repeat protein